MPAKARDLFDRIASFPALLEAARKAARGKRTKPGVASFLANRSLRFCAWSGNWEAAATGPAATP